MQKKFHKKAFTLIEMLIVIVIIGVLAASLIPRLTSVRDRANDVARKADLNQIATAVIARQMDHNGNLPGIVNAAPNDALSISGELKDAGLDSVPQDPKSVTQVSGLGDNAYSSTAGQYSYMRLGKNGIAGAAFIVMAKMETPGAANWIYDASLANSLITTGDDSSNLIPCKSMNKTLTAGVASLNPGGDCYFSGLDQLRFFIIR